MIWDIRTANLRYKMLHIKRRKDEEIYIVTSDGIVKMIINDIGQKQVSIGFDNPGTTTILCGELYKKLRNGDDK